MAGAGPTSGKPRKPSGKSDKPGGSGAAGAGAAGGAKKKARAAPAAKAKPARGVQATDAVTDGGGEERIRGKDRRRAAHSGPTLVHFSAQPETSSVPEPLNPPSVSLKGAYVEPKNGRV